MLPKCFGNLSLMPCWECSASLLGTCQSRSGNLNRWFGMLWAPLNGWGLAWDSKHSVASSWKKCYFRRSWNYFIFTKDVWSPQLISALLKGNPPLTGCLCHLFSSLQQLNSSQGPLQGMVKTSPPAHGPVLLTWKEMGFCSFSSKQRWESSKRPWNGATGTKCAGKRIGVRSLGSPGGLHCWARGLQITHQEPETTSTINRGELATPVTVWKLVHVKHGQRKEKSYDSWYGTVSYDCSFLLNFCVLAKIPPGGGDGGRLLISVTVLI